MAVSKHCIVLTILISDFGFNERFDFPMVGGKVEELRHYSLTRATLFGLFVLSALGGNAFGSG